MTCLESQGSGRGQELAPKLMAFCSVLFKKTGAGAAGSPPGRAGSPQSTAPLPSRYSPRFSPSSTEHLPESFFLHKSTQLDFRMEIYQLHNFSTEKIAAYMPYLFRRRCPLELIVLVALVMETPVGLELDRQT